MEDDNVWPVSYPSVRSVATQLVLLRDHLQPALDCDSLSPRLPHLFPRCHCDSCSIVFKPINTEYIMNISVWYLTNVSNSIITTAVTQQLHNDIKLMVIYVACVLTCRCHGPYFQYTWLYPAGRNGNGRSSHMPWSHTQLWRLTDCRVYISKRQKYKYYFIW